MAAPSVTFDGTRVNASDANTNWGNFGSGGGAPAAEAQIAYQNSLAVNTKHAGTALDGIDYDPGSGAIDMSAAGDKLWFAKCIVADGADTNLTKGAVLYCGSSSANYAAFVVAGTGELSNTGVFAVYPPQLGYIITSINPNVTTWNDTALDAGTIDQTAVDWFGFQGAMIVGGAKGENIALDSIDVGRGLNLVGGDGVSTDAVFADFVAADQDIKTNRWGVVFDKFGIIYAQGWLVIGRNASGTVVHTDFTDPDAVVVFPDAYIDEGDFGVEFDISDASSVMDFGGTIIGRGSLVSGNDTRPDAFVTEDGTAGTLTLHCKLQNMRNITLTDGVTVDGAQFEFLDMTQAGAHILNTTLTTTSAANVGALNDATFGTSTGIHDTEFIQGGLGHAVEVDGTSQTITLTNMTWTGYGSTGTSSAAIDFTGTGTHTVNWSGGTAPTVNNSGTGTVNIVNPVAVVVTVKDIVDETVIAGAWVYLEAATGGDLPAGAAITSITTATTTATVTTTAAHNLTTGNLVKIRGTNHEELNITASVTVTGGSTFEYTIVSIGGASGSGTMLCTAVIINEDSSAGSYFDFDGTSDYIGSPDPANPAATDDLDIKVWATPATVPPSTRAIICGIADTAQWCFALFLETSGALRLVVSPDGTATSTKNSTSFITADMRGFRARYDQVANEVDFFYTLDNSGFDSEWLPLGTQGIALGTNLFTTSTADLMLGSTSTVYDFTGTIHRAEVSYAGTVVANPDFADATGSPYDDALSNTWTATGATFVSVPKGVSDNPSFPFGTTQPVVGVVRQGDVAPFYQQGIISGNITADGFAQTVFLVRDS